MKTFVCAYCVSTSFWISRSLQSKPSNDRSQSPKGPGHGSTCLNPSSGEAEINPWRLIPGVHCLASPASGSVRDPVSRNKVDLGMVSPVFVLALRRERRSCLNSRFSRLCSETPSERRGGRPNRVESGQGGHLMPDWLLRASSHVPLPPRVHRSHIKTQCVTGS